MINFTMLVRDRSRLTRQSLESLEAAGLDGLGITILDDSSAPETRDFLREWARKHLGSWLERKETSEGTGKARNDVIAASMNAFGRGDYLYLSDNDVFFHPLWRGLLIASYEAAWKEGFRVLGAYGHPYHIPEVRAGIYLRDNGMIVREVQALALQSMIMRWEVWDKYGPFCQTPIDRVCQSEDVDFTNKLKADGFKLGVVDPPLIMSTGITNTFGEHIPGWEMVKAQCPEGVICE